MSTLRFLPTLFCGLLFAATSCTTEEPKTEPVTEKTDPLPSWNDSERKTKIMDFVSNITDPNHPDFVPVADRIATFDNDGTLWSEQPVYFQLLFAVDRILYLAPQHPEWEEREPFATILNWGLPGVTKITQEELMEVIVVSHTHLTTDEFHDAVSAWMDTAQHPIKKVPYTDLVFQPMLELINYLEENEFKVFIVSGGGVDFMRPWAEGVYGIPKHQIIGSSFETKFVATDQSFEIQRLPSLNFFDDKEAKAVAIDRFIGRRPIFAAGNSDGDLQMLQWTSTQSLPFMNLYIHHTDAEREWAYDRESHIDGFNIGWDEAKAKGWTVVDMAKDWKQIYPEK
ncbi:HAD family hydrolase [Phaeocystidibacter marisrubri]|uniref:phosphoserine phosphatase n=1 Tax=Phaeocystidibacter marisrubri TaxID=1577780 RepID=A0A6L3ZJX6_9FLAO|nr:HAD family hydrolase [Phaeocystidibacter marisrubri]KAB2817983.1 haloacid dehalogenase-like hydrolase [Phaeocystidibacter marisrubri]GGH72548.1 haloacid dehalogenase [Phaeocystidibacter marisrubri]